MSPSAEDDRADGPSSLPLPRSLPPSLGPPRPPPPRLRAEGELSELELFGLMPPAAQPRCPDSPHGWPQRSLGQAHPTPAPSPTVTHRGCLAHGHIPAPRTAMAHSRCSISTGRGAGGTSGSSSCSHFTDEKPRLQKSGWQVAERTPRGLREPRLQRVGGPARGPRGGIWTQFHCTKA